MLLLKTYNQNSLSWAAQASSEFRYVVFLIGTQPMPYFFSIPAFLARPLRALLTLLALGPFMIASIPKVRERSLVIALFLHAWDYKTALSFIQKLNSKHSTFSFLQEPENLLFANRLHYICMSQYRARHNR